MLRGPILVLALALAAGVDAAPFAPGRVYVKPDAATGDFFGASLVTMANLFVVGASYDDTVAADAGAVYLLDIASGAPIRTITAPGGKAGDRFGSSMTLIGTSLVVGAPHADSGAPHAGAVHVFDLASGTHRRTFPDPTPGFDDLFGAALTPCADGGLAIGAPFDGSGGTAAGSVFVVDPAAGGLRLLLPNPDGEAYSLFGNALAASGRLVIIGAPLASKAASHAGATYLIDLDDGSVRATLVSPRPRPGDRFGEAVAAGSAGILVGAPFDDTAASHGGAAYLFDPAGTLLRTFTAPDAAIDDRLGSSVALGDGLVLLGAPFANGETANDAGRAYVFDANDGTLLATFESPSPFEGEQFGGTVAFEGRNVVVGALHDGLPVTNAGSVTYFVDVGQPTTTSTSTTVTTTTIIGGSTTTTTVPDGTTTTTTTTIDPGSTSTTTLEEPPPTTTTTLPIACELGSGVCADGDACTTDSCDAGVCRFTPVAGEESVLCRVTTMAETLGVLTPTSRKAKRARTRLGRQLVRVRALIELAGHRSGAKSRRLLGRAGLRLTGFSSATQDASARGLLPPAIGERLLTLASDAALRLAILRAAVSG